MMDSTTGKQSKDLISFSIFSSNNKKRERVHWSNQREAFLSFVGLSVGLGNLWRFPVLAYGHGGGAFLISYLVLQLFVGKPMYFIEIVIGQYSGNGPIGAMSLCAGAKGVGLSMIVVSLCVSIYYQVIIVYAAYFMFASCQLTLPWKSCSSKKYDGEHCIGGTSAIRRCNNDTEPSIACICSGNFLYDFNTSLTRCHGFYINYSRPYSELVSSSSNCSGMLRCTNRTKSAPHLYFYHEVVKLARNLEYIGTPLWYLTLCLVFSWIIYVIPLFKRISYSPRIRYVIMSLPYIALVILICVSSTSNGFSSGIKYFFTPRWSDLSDVKVWLAAGSQVFFSMGITFGCIISYGRHNQFHHNIFREAIIVSTIDLVTSILAGICVFASLGVIAHEAGKPVNSIEHKGYGMVFVAYPDNVSRLPAPQIWSFLFFLMMMGFGLRNEFVLVDNIIESISEEYQLILQYKGIFIVIVCSSLFLLALPLMTPGGLYVMELMDKYGTSNGLYVVALSELIAVCYIYGLKRLLSDFKCMVGYKPKHTNFWKIVWALVTPVLLACLVITSFVLHKPSAYYHGEPLDAWAQAVGWTLFILIILPIPVTFIREIIKVDGSTIDERIYHVCQPSSNWLPQERSRTKLHSNTNMEYLNIPYREARIVSFDFSQLGTQSSRGETSSKTHRNSTLYTIGSDTSELDNVIEDMDQEQTDNDGVAVNEGKARRQSKHEGPAAAGKVRRQSKYDGPMSEGKKDNQSMTVL